MSFLENSFAKVQLQNLPIKANPSALAMSVLDTRYITSRAEDIE
jgi:hypothetical protein